jgi:hypothetical protein
MKIHCSFVEFHTPVFSKGKNHGMKIYADSKTVKVGISLWYDTDLRLMFMNYNGEITFADTFHTANPIDPSLFIETDLAHKSKVLRKPQATAEQ